ncbi:MAG: hypothetical protein J6Y75_08740 [Spirochaetaceae bacterium]|nr:hypothetical protein [Spirochaetaceae bacterium]
MKKTFLQHTLFLLLTLSIIVSFAVTSCGGGGGGGGGGTAAGPAPASTDSSSTGTPTPVANTAEDEEQETPEAALSSNAEILSFVIAQAENPVPADLAGVCADGSVTVSYPYGTISASAKASLIPTITVSDGATITSESGVAQDFTNAVTYTVTAQDGTTKEWDVNLQQLANTHRSISYDLLGGSSNTPLPTSFDINTEDVSLPSGNNLHKDNYIFEGWFDQASGNIIQGWSAGEKSGMGQEESVELTASWIPAPCVSDNRVYANGFSLIVEGSGSETRIYYDDNGNGIKDSNDYALNTINSAYPSNFNGYNIFAGHSGNEATKADYPLALEASHITINGGTLSNVYGYNGNGSRDAGTESYVTIANTTGNLEIGNKTDSGIWLRSFSDYVVTINGSISSANGEAITLIAAGAVHDGSIVAKSVNGSNYADAGKFTLRNSNRQNKINVNVSNGNVVVIGSVDLPAVVQWSENGDYFTLGEDNISANGTYFSVFVNGGYFVLGTTSIEGADFDMAIPYDISGAVNYMDADKGQTLNLGQEYRYVQFKSQSGTISAQATSDFLAQIQFHTASSITVNINLQTVPFAEIQSADVTYFDGSFYKIVNVTDNDKSWDTAYNAAKASTFNGLHGYLMTITSDIENKFIYDRVYKNKGYNPSDATGWIGATRGNNLNSTYDALTWKFASNHTTIPSSNSLNTKWYWACGPEAGKAFYEAKKYATGQDYRTAGMYSSWNNPKDFSKNGLGTGGGAEPNDSSNEYCAQYVGTYCWNDLSHYKYGTAGQYVPGSYIVEYTAYTNSYRTEAATNTALSAHRTYTH